MKNEIKILIAAIVVILIILVGAYALSGSSPQPTATPTAVPVTATPTPVPANGGNTGTGTATPAPTAAPTVTPTLTPTPEPESGVKQTEFGYWITYPPLPPQNWSTNPPPAVPPYNVVFFDPTSATMALNGDSKEKTLFWDGDYQKAYVYRVGNMSETVLVTIHMDTSSNIAWGEYDAATPATFNYRASMHGKDPDNFTDLGAGDYELTFGPGVTEQDVCIHVDPYYIPSPNPEALNLIPAGGWVRLTITGADSGYGVLQSNKDFNLNIAYLPVVQFNGDHGYLYVNDGSVDNETDDFYSVNVIGDNVYVTFEIDRDISAGALPISFSTYEYNLTSSDYTISPFTFAGGSSTGYVTVSIKKGLILDGTYRYVFIYIEDTDSYLLGPNDEFAIYLNK